jgi:hypothetical protein
MRERDSREIGLEPVKRAAFFRPAKKGCSAILSIRIRFIALREISRATVRARTARNCGWNHHAIAALQISDSFAHLFDNAHAFMAENCSRHHIGDGTPYEMSV